MYGSVGKIITRESEMKIFKVKYSIRHAGLGWGWEGQDQSVNVAAKNAEAAIEKAKSKRRKPVKDDQDGKVYKCTAFEIDAVNLLCEAE